MATHVDLHLLIKPVVEQKIVRHANAVRLHGMPLAIVVVSDVGCAREHISCNSAIRKVGAPS